METIWLPTLFVNAAQVEIGVGVRSNHQWLCRWGNNTPDLISREGKHTMMLWPLMDVGYGGNYSRVFGMIESRLEESSLDTELAKKFPFLDIAMHAFNSSTRREEALEWISNLEFDEQLAEFVAEKLQNRRHSQAIRHTLKRKYHDWEKAKLCGS